MHRWGRRGGRLPRRVMLHDRSLLLPGQPLPLAKGERVQASDGTYAYGDYVMASRIGYAADSTPGTVRVQGTRPPLVLPQPESVVLGRVTRVTPRQATVSILVVDGQPCGGAQAASVGARTNHAAGEGIDGSEFQGLVRAQDVRTTDKDNVVLSECFRPGDIVRAVVLSLGDARSYYLSTARNDLGVVHATGGRTTNGGWTPARHTLQPISWREMADSVTGTVERRKCAKPEWLN